VLLISHDLPAVREVCRDVSVLYAGRLVEQGPAEDVFLQPRHPYTRALLDARPAGVPRGVALRALPGVVPGAADVVPGCRFHPRCAEARARCREDVPTWTAGTTAVSCHFPLAPPVASPTPAVREGAG
jgi:oligopeptide/dipeptide ABC transporter ATP-binding protein